MIVTWYRCLPNNVWCDFDTLDLSKVNSEGVYVIWHGGSNPRTVRVGSGIVVQRIQAHRKDPMVAAYRQYGLFVTWADVPASFQQGVENYLADLLQPLVGERFPNVQPIEVNSPFAA